MDFIEMQSKNAKTEKSLYINVNHKKRNLHCFTVLTFIDFFFLFLPIKDGNLSKWRKFKY